MKAKAMAVLAAAGIIMCFSALEAAQEQKPPAGQRIHSREKARERAMERIGEIERKRASMAEQISQDREKIRELAFKFRTAETEAEKAGIKQQIRTLLEQGFDRRQALLEERLKELEAQCSRIREQVAEHQSRKEEILDRMLERLTSAGKAAPAEAEAGKREGRGARHRARQGKD